MVKLLSWGRRSSRDVWGRWPGEAYREARYQHRLATVSQQLAQALHACPASSIQVTSLCAGDGRDAIGTLANHPRREQVRATLVELHSTSVANGRAHAERVGLDQIVTFIEADGTQYATYRDIPPANALLVCGTWGHVPPHQRDEMMRAIKGLLARDGIVIWTRGVAKGMKRLDEITSLFTPREWQEVQVELTQDRQFAVASYRFVGAETMLPAEGTIFDFC